MTNPNSFMIIWLNTVGLFSFYDYGVFTVVSFAARRTTYLGILGVWIPLSMGLFEDELEYVSSSCNGYDKGVPLLQSVMCWN